MAVIPEFAPPSWLNDQDAETIHKRMMSGLPADMDDTEGGFPWDMTKPTALEKAEMLEFHLVETLKLMHPMWAYGKWLDYHALGEGLVRKTASAAFGMLEVTGVPGTEILSGFRFAVPSSGEIPAIEYSAVETVAIGEDGTGTVPVRAAEGGKQGNVPALSISMMVMPAKGITGIKNRERITGGTEEEEDESLRERVLDSRQSSDASFVGNDGDYIRWARNVSGVGDAFVIPQWDSAVPNSVKVVLLDANGEPANEHIIDEVYREIMSPDDPIARKAPVGAIVTVSSPAAKILDYAFRASVKEGYSLQNIAAWFSEDLKKYYQKARKEKVLRYNMLHSLLINTAGILDFGDFTVNGGMENIDLLDSEYPVTGSINTEGGAGG